MTIPNNSELKRNKEDLNLSPIPAQDQLIKVE